MVYGVRINCIVQIRSPRLLPVYVPLYNITNKMTVDLTIDVKNDL